MPKHDRFIELALREAEKSNMSKQHGAVIVLRGKVIATGHNKYQARALGGRIWREQLQDQLHRDWVASGIDVPFPEYANSWWGKSACSLHAEMDAIINASSASGKGSYHGATLYVTRRRPTDGASLASCPCKRCIKAAFRRNLKVVHT